MSNVNRLLAISRKKIPLNFIGDTARSLLSLDFRIYLEKENFIVFTKIMQIIRVMANDVQYTCASFHKREISLGF